MPLFHALVLREPPTQRHEILSQKNLIACLMLSVVSDDDAVLAGQ